MPQVVVYPAALAALMVVWGLFCWRVFPAWTPIAAGFWWIAVLPEAALLLLLLWVLSFFRNPYRDIPQDPTLLLAPADGTISDIDEAQEPAIGVGRALRIGIILSLFDVHINRMHTAVPKEKYVSVMKYILELLSIDDNRM